MAGIIRITLFKIPAKENQAKLLDLYRTLAASAKKVIPYFFPDRSRKKLTHWLQDGKPYILSLVAGQAHEDQRSQGYTVAAKSEFSTLEDMKYYDTDCEAHQTLKAGAKSLGVEGVMTVYFPPAVVSAIW
jgi:Stress responsive A/B Barrel Domain